MSGIVGRPNLRVNRPDAVKRSITTVVTPPSGAVIWFKKGVGQTVSQWTDQSGNANHLLQATATNQPVLNGDGTYTFDGVDNFMKCVGFTFSQPLTIGIRLKQESWVGNGRFCDGNAGNDCTIFQNGASPQFSIFAASTIGSQSLALTTWGSIVAVFNGASSILRLENLTEDTGNAGANNNAGFCLAAANGGASFSNITVSEILGYATALNATDRATLISYLDTK